MLHDVNFLHIAMELGQEESVEDVPEFIPAGAEVLQRREPKEKARKLRGQFQGNKDLYALV